MTNENTRAEDTNLTGRKKPPSLIKNILSEVREHGLLMGMSESDIENDHVYNIIKKYDINCVEAKND